MSDLVINIRVGRYSLLVYPLRFWRWRHWPVALVFDASFFKHFPDARWFAVYSFFGWRA